jgi:hypothetical protein
MCGDGIALEEPKVKCWLGKFLSQKMKSKEKKRKKKEREQRK